MHWQQLGVGRKERGGGGGVTVSQDNALCCSHLHDLSVSEEKHLDAAAYLTLASVHTYEEDISTRCR